MCLEHFIAACYEKLGLLSKNRTLWIADGTAWEFMSDILQECVERAEDLSQHKSEISNLDRARLLDIALWASELSQQVRRSPRSTFTVDIRVASEKPGHCWQEETQTLDLSLHGARLRCQHAVEIDDVLSVVRMDTGRRVDARVVRQRRISPIIQEIGIEFINVGDAVDP